MKAIFFHVLLLLVYGYIPAIANGALQSGSPVIRKAFDFIVGVDGDFKAALSAASRTASSGKRFYMFFPDGEYNIGTLTGNSNQMSTVSTSYISFIGQSADKTIVYNKSIQEGISVTATLYFNKANNLYLQDLTVLNKACYNNPSTYSTTSRHVAVMEEGNDILYKNVRLLSTQDTYYTKGNRTYWEDGEIHGTTDFICGGGDIFFNRCLLFIDKDSYITAPATSTQWGYVFMGCTIDGTVGSYKLGRAWKNTPRCVYINTVMKKQPTAAAWGDPMNVVPSLFAEYNSRTASGAAVNLSGRRTTYTKDGQTVTLNPVLTEAQAAKYTIENVMGGWRPDRLAVQVGAPVVRQEGTALVWADNDSALCWAVFRNGTFYRCVTENRCEITLEVARYTVRTANAMGGLGVASDTVLTDDKTEIGQTASGGAVAGIRVFSLAGKTVTVTLPPEICRVEIDIVSTGGKVIQSALSENTHTTLHLNNFATGMYMVRMTTADGERNVRTSTTRSILLWQ